MIVPLAEVFGNGKGSSGGTVFDQGDGGDRENLGRCHDEPLWLSHWPRRNSKGRELRTAKEQPGLFPVKGIVLAYSRPVMIISYPKKGKEKALTYGEGTVFGEFLRLRKMTTPQNTGNVNGFSWKKLPIYIFYRNKKQPTIYPVIHFQMQPCILLEEHLFQIFEIDIYQFY